MSATHDLARLVLETPAAAISDAVRDKARLIIVDTFGCIVSGAGGEVAEGLLRYAQASQSGGDTPILGTSMRASPECAAFVNGSFGHALEFDDVFGMLPGHPAAVILAAVISEIPRRKISGKSLTDAFIIGYEACARIGIAMTLEHHRIRGFHATSSLGIFGAVATLARLRGFSVEDTCVAFSTAASFASGLLAQIGSDMKPVHSGWAARNAIAAVDLVSSGIRGADDVLEAPKGFFNGYGTDRSKADNVARNFGAPWVIESPGVSLKKFPCCFAAHRGIDALLKIQHQHHVRWDDVKSITCRVPPKALVNMIHPRPKTGLQAKFSMEYCFVSTLHDRRSTLESFTDEQVNRPEMQAALAMVTNIEDPACEEGDGELSGTISGARGFIQMEVMLKDGTRLVERVAHAPGTPDRPMTWGEALDKIDICTGHAGFSAARAQDAKAALADYEACADLQPLLEKLRAKAQ